MEKITKEAVKQEIEEMMQYSELMYNRHLISAAGGNISFRCKNDCVLITASGAALRKLHWEDILLCSMDGNVLEGDVGKIVSKEYRIHLNCYAARPDVNCVFHLHPNYSVAFTAYDRELPLYSASARLKLGKVPMIAYGNPGSEQLANEVKRALTEYPQSKSFLMKAHGVLILEENFEEGFERAELLEDTAKIALLAAGADSMKQLIKKP